ncbi:hypothetical protein GH5_05098 [Leishmania sp. Ghana 2012 LV757]|uniref:hypothetical protein n=1 Tax=Leishmania sp. Ghana 2012 LV757 TaxID=2803181 RepID=UPI001B4A69E8|nr:hypothetical protein GH5_05098 [Leishmania sp. Ghana 2012 LV757]
MSLDKIAMRWALLAIALLCAAFIPVQGQVLGVQSQHMAYFDAAKEAGVFRCLDDSTTIPFSSVNDEICDCADGSDEPGTSACAALRGGTLTPLPPGWLFQCINDENVSQSIFHSRVNDGICDCCDGADEVRLLVSCPNRCAELAAELAQHRRAELSNMQRAREGKEVMRSAALLRREEAAKSLAELEAEHTELVASISRLEAMGVTAVEEKAPQETELVAKPGEWEGGHSEGESEDRAPSCIRWREAENCVSSDSNRRYTEKSCYIVVGQDRSGYCECEKKAEKDEREESEHKGAEQGAEDKGMEALRGTVTYHFPCGHPEFTCRYVCDHNGKMGVVEELDEMQGSSTAILNKAARGLSSQKQRLEEVERTLEAKKKLLSSPSITREELLRTLENKEFTLDTREYTYSISLFDNVYQRNKGSEHSVLLGSWKSFGESTYAMWAKDAYDFSQMIYDEGWRCWNNAERKVEVHLVCGPENKLMVAEELLVCKYRMVFQTPAMCDD